MKHGVTDMTFFYSAAHNIFVSDINKTSYEDAGSWPEDAKEVSDELFYQYSQNPPKGKIRSHADGLPIWEDVPPMTEAELILKNKNEKQLRIDEANNYMNGKQWPGKAAIGRLKGEELAQYNLWLDYLDALELVDTSSAPDIEWPTPPAVQAR